MSNPDAKQPAPADWLDLKTTATPVRVGIWLLTAFGFVAVAFVHGDNPILAVLLCSVVIAYGQLSIVDAAEQRLPNRITLPLAGATFAAVFVGGIVRSDIGAGFGAMGIGLAFAVVLFIMRFGMGDVKMALTVGAIAGWLGQEAVFITMFAGAIAGAVVAVVLLLVYRRRAISFSYGPFLAIGSVAGMIASGL